MLQIPIPFAVIGTGEYKPSRLVSSEAFDVRFGRRGGWTERQVGVASRRFVDEGETSSYMGAQASQRALEAAGISLQQIDCIISASAVMEQPIPCLASQIQHALGLGESGIPAFDVNATCLSFIAAIDLIACAFMAGRYRRALIVSSEIASAGLDMNDVTTASLFGDGAAAVVVEARRGGTAALLASHIETYGAGGVLCQLRSGGTRMSPHRNLEAFLAGSYFEMNGKAIYRMVAERFPAFFERLLSKAGMQPDDITCVIPHQASGRALDHAVELLRLRADRVVRVLHDHGNQIAASLPVALHTAIVSRRIAPGDTALLLGSGAGLSLGGVLLRY